MHGATGTRRLMKLVPFAGIQLRLFCLSRLVHRTERLWHASATDHDIENSHPEQRRGGVMPRNRRAMPLTTTCAVTRDISGTDCISPHASYSDAGSSARRVRRHARRVEHLAAVENVGRPAAYKRKRPARGSASMSDTAVMSSSSRSRETPCCTTRASNGSADEEGQEQGQGRGSAVRAALVRDGKSGC